MKTSTWPPVIVCDGCDGTLTITGAPGMDLYKCIEAYGWSIGEDGTLCHICIGIVTKQTSFKNKL